ncbi:TBC1 domain family member 5-like isoform X2 [Patiria miniata]|uniref:Rab-GAP TBC domain-containing protein n=1 Tax=Patiria miniata TaxID=46514 RepID=A0A914A2W5_PATMI|nr:TBC1 domain family member 5-like isoform X2 [Patiria miniata]
MSETSTTVPTAEDDIFAVLECFTPAEKKERILIQHSLDEDSVMLEDPFQQARGGNSGGRLAWAYPEDEAGNGEEVKGQGGGGETEGEASSSASTSNSYRDEWLRLFERPDYINVIKQEGLKGGLRSSRFRSVCWRVYLEVLPEHQDQWVASVQNDRERYAAIKRKYVVDPQTGSKSRDADLSLNNPLSQDEESPWNRFFQDKECRQEISQDVRRTFPEIEFFQTDEMHDMMVNILFCYCKEHEDLGYKQGMHEVLAPLIFILHCDQQAFLHAQEIKSQIPVVKGEREVVQEIMDPSFLEHDSYAMFYGLMDTMEPWYRHGTREEGALYRNASFKSAEPFSKPQECAPSSPLIKKLTKIQDVVLKMHDNELHLHLTRLDIQPQIFGIRWIRLLFGREFTLQDLLVLWDTIFADSITLDLIDYIFVAMLILVRELLLSGDYADCMTLLMRFPMVGDVRCLVDKALHLRDPKKFPRPPNYQFQILQHSEAGVVIQSNSRSPRRPNANGAFFSGPQITSNFGVAPKNKKTAAKTSGFGSLKRITNKGKQNEDRDPSQNASPSHPLAAPADVVSEVKSRPLKKTTSPQQETNMQSFSSEGIAVMTGSSMQTPKKENLGGLFSKSRSAGKKNQQKEQETDMLNQVALMQGKMNDVQNMCRYCATKMEAHLMQIQDEMVKLKLTQEDELLLAVAGLKQVKDILNGTLKFAQGMEEQEDLIINDDYYGKVEENPSPPVSKMDLSPESELDNDGTQPKVVELEDMDVTSPDSNSADSDQLTESTPMVGLNTSECNNNFNVTSTATADDASDDSRAKHDGNLVVASS